MPVSKAVSLDAAALGCPQPVSKPTTTPEHLGPFWTTGPRQGGVEPSRFGSKGVAVRGGEATSSISPT